MDSRVIKRMFTHDAILHIPQKDINSLGDKSSLDISIKVYFVKKVEKVINSLGEEETSTLQVYLKGKDALQIIAGTKITCNAVKHGRIIKEELYYKPNNEADVGVLYVA